jgi:hypothetical protein
MTAHGKTDLDQAGMVPILGFDGIMSEVQDS